MIQSYLYKLKNSRNKIDQIKISGSGLSTGGRGEWGEAVRRLELGFGFLAALLPVYGNALSLTPSPWFLKCRPKRLGLVIG